ncbi:MAG TPA: class I SAM-dependent methyltransferase [Thermoanaerobaculia bacterium]|nr:class I SAM-dependent methyltransferase [Thermoanaerobaculia bacterium]
MTDTEREPLAPHPTLPSYYDEDRERQRFVNDLFDRGSRHYDWVNRVMSLGSGYWYRGEVLRRAGLGPGMRVLDVATGTGAVAAVASEIVTASGMVVGVDPSGGMLRQARQNVKAHFVQAVGETLAIRGDTFDMLTMGYALRHVSDLRAAFREYRRVLKPGGRLVIMEISVPRSRMGAALLRTYMGRLVPLVSRFGTRSRDTEEMMRYYWDTTASCVAPAVILDALVDAGFADVRREVRYGFLSEYRASRPDSPLRAE